jgi:hypothetical protein
MIAVGKINNQAKRTSLACIDLLKSQNLFLEEAVSAIISPIFL